MFVGHYGVSFALKTARRGANYVGVLVAAAIFSHWVLDFIVHRLYSLDWHLAMSALAGIVVSKGRPQKLPNAFSAVF